jgi:hypothetical protein
MSNKIKHIQRSHKTYGHAGAIFSGFERKAYSKAYTKSFSKDYTNPGHVLEMIKTVFKNLFKRHQSR